MAIDTAAKRRSAVATRRLPWFRRFQPAPDGTISQGDRQSLAFVYSGILAEAAASTGEPDQLARFAARATVATFAARSTVARFAPRSELPNP